MSPTTALGAPLRPVTQLRPAIAAIPTLPVTGLQRALGLVPVVALGLEALGLRRSHRG